MSAVKVFKTTSVPAELVADAIYLVANGSFVEMYVTSTTGVAKRIPIESDVQGWITTAMAGVNGVTIVADITARNALTPTANVFVYVADATGDTSVAAGAAMYLYNHGTTTWVKVTEYESLDLVMSWANLTGKPTSTPAAIDAAVTAATHSNRAVLDLLSVSGGLLQYNGSPVTVVWETPIGW
jgi:hypothetical protein